VGISGDFFKRIRADKKVFGDEIHADFYARCEEMDVLPFWNKGRCLDAYFQWEQDLRRVEGIEDKVGVADHLKCAAHLIYWLRRSSPVDGFTNGKNEYSNQEITPAKEFMAKYGREYLALDLGYRAAQLYEIKLHGRNLPAKSFPLRSSLADVPPRDFIESTCHVMKTKMLPPHALLVILKAVFLRP
jgi:hypothetical protein